MMERALPLLRVGLSPCPNDTFIFHALLHGLVPFEVAALEPVLADVEELNRRARDRELEVSKISFHAYGLLTADYRLLRSGAALGRGCGPLVVCRPELARAELAGARVAIPGRLTSAALLLRLFEPRLRAEQLVEMTFDRILDAVAAGEVEAGLIIHESRFTYRSRGLVERVDLGRWWEESEGLPIPLGGIIARRDLGAEVITAFEKALRASVVHAREHPEASRGYVRKHAQELADEVTRAHIDLYVNDFTVDLGDEGLRAVARFLGRARQAGVLG